MKLKSIIKGWFGLNPYPPHQELMPGVAWEDTIGGRVFFAKRPGFQQIWETSLAAHIDAATRGPRSALPRYRSPGDGA